MSSGKADVKDSDKESQRCVLQKLWKREAVSNMLRNFSKVSLKSASSMLSVGCVNYKKAEKDSSFVSVFKIIISLRIKDSGPTLYAKDRNSACNKARVCSWPSWLQKKQWKYVCLRLWQKGNDIFKNLTELHPIFWGPKSWFLNTWDWYGGDYYFVLFFFRISDKW